MTDAPPSPELRLALRNGAFEALVEMGELAESYARSLREAAWRGDQTTVEVHLRQLRLVVIDALKTYKEFLEDGQAAKSRDRQGQRPGDAVA